MLQIIAVLMAALQVASVGAASPPRPIDNPGGWIAVSDYPPAALAAHQQGTVGFSLAVDAEGTVTGCRVISSSSAVALDEATCRLIQPRARFEPARDAAGRAIAGTFTSRVRWEFPRVKATATPAAIELPDRIRHRYGSSTLYIGADGIIEKCTPTVSPYDNILPAPDICAAYPAGAHYGPPTTFHGKPIGRKVTIGITVDETNIK